MAKEAKQAASIVNVDGEEEPEEVDDQEEMEMPQFNAEMPNMVYFRLLFLCVFVIACLD